MADWVNPKDWLVMESKGNGYHVVPIDDIAEHQPCVSCWCQPHLEVRDLETGDEQWLHHCARDNPQ
jgi:hypothetical protein